MIRGELYQGKPCKRGHSGLRYRSNNSCIYCADDHNAKAAQKRAALAPDGARTYQGTQCRKGHDGLRYVKSGLCVACVKASNAAREAAKRKAKKNAPALRHRRDEEQLEMRL